MEEPALLSFARLASTYGGPRPGAPYAELWEWSVRDSDAFWRSVTTFCGMNWETAPRAVTDGSVMPRTQWFPGGRINYVSQVFARPRTGAAVIGHDETGITRTLSWTELEEQVKALAATLARTGVSTGDRVVGYLPDRPEAVVAFLATASLGAVWAGCGTDLAGDAALARFEQLEPTCLIAAAGYHHRGRRIDRTHDVETLRAGLPTVSATILVGDGHTPSPSTITWESAVTPQPQEAVAPLAVPSDHPLWVLFSSGTTGPPKGIVHSHSGVVAEHLKTLRLFFDMREGDQFFWYTTLNWMMWNLRLGGLLCGATIHCFDGAPTARALWEVAERGQITHLGLSPGYLSASRDGGLRPAADFDLGPLRMLGCTGAVLTATVHQWITDELGPTVAVSSTTGGTDVVSGFAGGVPTVESRPGEITARWLGVDMHAWSAEQESLSDQVGELVITSPLPSMPIRFWNDPDGSRYHSAYFDHFPGVWRHGDWVTVTSRGSIVVHGRSDATLNRHGIRMGTADICQAAEDLPEVLEALVVGVEEPNGGYWMPMFVTLAPGVDLDAELGAKIQAAIRDSVSPRHVPDEVIHAPGIPHTMTGKKLEVPVKNILRGLPVSAAQSSAIDQPALMGFYQRAGERRRSTTK
ncbi:MULTISPECIES: acetoacetate--CoA ligase [unclassified Dietzia]|uniref:acetoacetate--CoA ligase n=1 Tax=unclassified Dietzia TaxID=2617939 RepID=UPI0015FE39D3|nr:MULTISPECIES: acetoacetate--CoA ligase [unclassified Dietzia]MBB1024183.1 acetoacetate--CoA ligase [Dietzia sp. DQ12-76]MBB1026330.1 acetoacetate--CoA ligase [Dietzia sp. DQ11-38-2]